MKKLFYLLSLIVVTLTTSFDDDQSPSDYYPVLMKRTDLEKSVFIRDAQNIETPGKIYYKDNFIYLNEKYKGIHVIDNTNPLAPDNVAFINIPGCIDIAIKNQSLLADNAIDLVSIDLSNGLNDLEVTKRVKNVFPESTPPDLDYIPGVYSHSNRPVGTVIVRWEPKNP